MIAQRQGLTPQLMPQEYLAWEAQQPCKYGYMDGEVYAMTGGTIAHNDVALNLASLLKSHLRGKGCKVQIADAKVGVSAEGPFHYPDVVVSCDPRDRRANQVLYYPCLIVEVLSPSTAAFDRGQKFAHYRRIDTLREYVLISAETINVECYRLNQNQKWELTAYAPEESFGLGAEGLGADLSVEFASVGFECALSALYEDVVFPVETIAP
jgi:Uma2 family endonuclease